MNIEKNKLNKDDEIAKINKLIDDIDADYLRNKEYWFNFYTKYVPNLSLPVQQRILRTPFRNVLSRNRSNPRVQQTSQRLFSLQERVNTQTHTITLNTIENNSVRSREKLDDFIRAWENNQNNLQDLLDELKNLIKKLSKDILIKLDNLNKLLQDMINIINDNFNELKEIINSNFNELKEVINNNLKTINDSLLKIDDSLIKLNNSVIEFNKSIIKKIEHESTSIKAHVDNKGDSILDSINTLKLDILGEFAAQLTLIEGTILGVIEAVNANLFIQLSWQTFDIDSAFESSLFFFKRSINGSIKNLEGSIKKTINDLENNIKEFLNKNLKKYIMDGLDEWLSKNKKMLYEELVEQICCNIVGESYIKYDGDNLYMPTLIFKYKNKNNYEKRRYSQIKLRLNLKPEDITDNIVDDLRLKIQSIAHITYNFGNLRCLYVSEKRLFKTTLFTSSKDDIINLFDKIIPITETKFLKENISYTENSKRDYDIRKKQPLKDTNLNKFEKFSLQEMTLNSVFLQINGLDRQVKLY